MEEFGRDSKWLVGLKKKIVLKKFGIKEDEITLKSSDTPVKVRDPNIENQIPFLLMVFGLRLRSRQKIR